MASRYLNNIRINDAYTFPDNDGSDGQAIVTDGNGNLTFGSAVASSADSSESVHIPVKNASGSQILKGTPVYVTGSVGASGKIEIAPANSATSSTMPCLGLLESTLADDAEGFCVQSGLLEGLATTTIDGTSASSNDTVYVKSGGGLTLAKPTGTALIQNIAKVARVHASNGSLVVSAILRTNDVPNLPSGKIWVGDSNTVTSTVIHLDETNSRLGINDTTPGVSVDINATDAIKIPAGTEAQRPTGIAGMLRYNSDDDQFEGYTTEWGAIAGSGGGGGGALTIEKNVYTGDNSDTTFNTTSTITSENNVQVYLDGVYQSKDNYTTSGSTVTFSTAPPTGISIELIHITSLAAAINTETFTGDGSDTTFDLALTITNENNTQIYIDGVYQSKNNYTTSSKTITFSTAPPNGSNIEVVHLKTVDYSTNSSNQFTGNGSTTAFTLSETISDENNTMVFIQGVYQEKSTYSISGTSLTFLTAPQNGYSIEVMTTSSTAILGNANDAKYSVSVISSDTAATVGKLYVLTGTCTLTLPSSPSTGDSIKISNRSGVATATIARNGNKIMGAAADLTLDKLNAGFEMIYSGAAEGWILIGVEGTAA